MQKQGNLDTWVKTTLELLDDIPSVIPIQEFSLGIQEFSLGIQEFSLGIQEFSLGILGSSDASYWNANTISDIINPIISEAGKIPTSLSLPAKGITSLLIQAWGEKQKISCNVIDSDWIRLGRKARALQDSRIIKDSSHLVFFVGSRSDYYEKIAIREAKKGKTVYTVDGKTRELVEWVL